MPVIAGGASLALSIFQVTVSLVASKIAQGWAGKPKQKYKGQAREITSRDTVQPRQLIYGEVRTGGFLAYHAVGGANNKYYWVIIVVAGHQVHSFTEFWIDNTRIRLSDFGSDWTFGVNNILHPRFMHDIPDDGLGSYSRLAIYASLGDSDGEPTLQALIAADIPEWDDSHIGRGLPYFAVRMEFDEAVWPNGAPQDSFGVPKGRYCYDPRKDSTNGGSGSHRYDDATTWEYANNPALVVADYITGGSITYDIVAPNRNLTVAEDPLRVDWAAAAVAANICDQAVAVPIAVLQGVTTWTNALAIVTGVDTAFGYQLVAGNYLYGPDAAFYQVLSVESDTSLTLTGTYAGSTISGETTQYHTSATTSTTQKRYTCDVQLSLGDTHLQNLTTLLSSMAGYCLYSQGKYKIYAGAYIAPTVALTEAEMHGDVDFVSHPTGDENYNVVTGTFYDENRGWTLSDFPPQTDSSYQTDDGSVDTRSIELHATRDYFRSQRIARLHLLQGRNKQILGLKQLLGSGRKLAPMISFTAPIDHFGLTTEIWRAEEVRIRSDGYVELTARITSAASFADPAVNDYTLPRNQAPGSLSATEPEVPTSFIATGKEGYIHFDWNATTTLMAAATMEIWEYSAATPFSSATRIWQGVGTSADIGRSDLDTSYYWLTRVLNGIRSDQYPVGSGVAGRAATLSTNLILIARGDCITDGSTAYKATGSATYDSDVYSARAFSGGAYCEYTVPSLCAVRVGLNSSPSAAMDDVTLDYALAHGALAGLVALENGASVAVSGGSYAAGDRFRVEYDNYFVRYFQNGNPIREVAASGGLTLAFDSSFKNGDRIENITYGPWGEALPPSAISSLVATAFPTYIRLTVGSASLESDELIEIWEYTANTPFSSASRIDEGAKLVFQIPKRDTTTRYYWARKRRGNSGVLGAEYPSGNGVAGVADQVQTGDTPAYAFTDVQGATASSTTITQQSHSPDNYTWNDTIVSVTYTPPVACDIEISVSGELNYTPNDGFGVSFYHSIQLTNNSYDTSNRLEQYDATVANGSSRKFTLGATKRFSVSAGVALTFSWLAHKFSNGDTVTVVNADLRMAAIKR